MNQKNEPEKTSISALLTNKSAWIVDKKAFALEIICILFIILFVYTGAIKLMSYDLFVIQISKSPMLVPIAKLAAWAIPTAELLVAVMLAVKRLRKIGLYAFFTLMVMFTSYIIAILQFSEEIPCSCGGVISTMGWTEHLIFNIVFCILGVIGIVLYSRISPTKNLL